MSGKKHTPATSRPDAEEWDFSKCPTDELDYCCYYEYARHDEGLKKEVVGHRASDSWGSGLSPEHWAYYQKHWLLTFFRFFKEYPATPWLKIPAKERKKRCDECRLLEGPFLTISPDRLDSDSPYPYTPLDVGIDTMHKIYVVEVDWSASVEAIERAFTRWRIANQPGQELVKEKRGGVTHRDLLKALGAYRLVECLGGWQEAANWSANKSHDGESLYGDQSGWINARKKALKYMDRGVAPSPMERLSRRLDMSALTREERARIKVHIMKNVDRGEARRLNELEPAVALAELRSGVALAHKPPG